MVRLVSTISVVRQAVGRPTSAHQPQSRLESWSLEVVEEAVLVSIVLVVRGEWLVVLLWEQFQLQEWVQLNLLSVLNLLRQVLLVSQILAEWGSVRVAVADSSAVAAVIAREVGDPVMCTQTAHM